MATAFQQEICPPLPIVINPCIEYKKAEIEITKISEILDKSGIEDELVKQELARWEKEQGSSQNRSPKEQRNFEEAKARKAKQLHIAFRCNVAHSLLGNSYREFSIALAAWPLLQWFTRTSHVDGARPPAKSSLERYDKIWDVQELKTANRKLLQKVFTKSGAKELCGADEPFKSSEVYVDTTCVKANIHVPVDWVLLRDAIRTIITVILTLRKHGLLHRMASPESFLKKCNKLCIAMAMSRHQKGGSMKRKHILRKLKLLAKTVGKHGERYLALLGKLVESGELTQPQADQFAKRLQNVIDKLPAAIHQAHERIIGERKVANKDKMLSLYEDDVHVLVRHKDGAECEFGNKQVVVEQEDGLVLDWELFKDEQPADCKLIEPLIARISEHFGDISAVVTDRGFDSKSNSGLLEENNIFNGICPKNIQELQQRLGDPSFAGYQRRRAQTEGRIAIIKDFIGDVPRSKGFDHRNREVAWGIFTHNLWKLSHFAMENAKLRKAA